MNFPNDSITNLFGIKYPIVQGGMVYCSGANLAAGASNTGALGLIGSGSMRPELLRSQIQKAKTLTSNPFGINIPLLYKDAPEFIDIALEEGVKIFFTSAGSPKKFTKKLKDSGAIVVHVTSSPLLAKKCEDAGVDAIVAEGFEAGGHNGREEITTMSLIPQVRDIVSIPVIAAGGIADGRQVAAAFCLGANGVQIGTGFAATIESSAHDNFKQAIVSAEFGDTKLMMKKLVPVRLLKNSFYEEVEKLEANCAGPDELSELLGKGRARAGMLEGDIENGELEIGQVCSMVTSIPSCEDYVQNLLKEFKNVSQ